MTTQEKALAQLFGAPALNTGAVVTPERRRVEATYCPKCGGWVEVRLQPVRLHCTRCGLEARP